MRCIATLQDWCELGIQQARQTDCTTCDEMNSIFTKPAFAALAVFVPIGDVQVLPTIVESTQLRIQHP